MVQQTYTRNNQDKPNWGQGRQFESSNIEPLDTSEIVLKPISAELFNKVAKNVAKTIAENTKSNKPTQLRKFYDEIVMWDQKLIMVTDKNKRVEKFIEYLPFIKMLNAKVAYAKGRKSGGHELIDDNFVKLISHCLESVECPETMRNFKLFMEAFMGFYKEKRPKD